MSSSNPTDRPGTSSSGYGASSPSAYGSKSTPERASDAPTTQYSSAGAYSGTGAGAGQYASAQPGSSQYSGGSNPQQVYPYQASYGGPGTVGTHNNYLKVISVVAVLMLVGIAGFFVYRSKSGTADMAMNESQGPSDTPQKLADAPGRDGDAIAPTTASTLAPTGAGASAAGQTIASLKPNKEPADPQAAATEFLKSWERGDYTFMQSLVSGREYNMTEIYGGAAKRLRIESVKVAPGAINAQGAVPYKATVKLRGYTPWTYDGQVPTTKLPSGENRVQFAPAVQHPSLKAGQSLDMVPVGKTPGLTFRDGKTPLTQSKDLAANIVGTPASSTKAATGLYRVLAESNTPLSDAAAAPSVQIVVVNKTNAVQAKLDTLTKDQPAGAAATGIPTTFDLKTQLAAEKAVKATKGQGAVVAIDAATGEIRALANNPITGAPTSIAHAYPPGSTFKVITAAAALSNGTTASTPMTCPATADVEGMKIQNYEGGKMTGSVPFSTIFAQSCNTAFVQVSQKLPSGALVKTAEQFGFNQPQPLKIASKGGSIPAIDSAREGAVSALGQGRIQASPLHMASVAGAVASGTWHQPRVMQCGDCKSSAIPHASELKTLMRSVVTSGSGSAVAGVKGGPVYGKTGTAEYGTGAKPPTHAWFIGFQGNTAFSVFSYNGKSGGSVAAPIAATFLNAL